MATSEVLIKIPALTFNEDKLRLAPPADTTAFKVAQLEHNMRFLRDQHQIMLTSLHKEIENLRQFNRELQFQLVMSGAAAKMSALSIEVPADSFEAMDHSSRSSNDFNRLELLEKSLAEMRIGLNEEKGRNKQLYEVVREQQRKIEHLKALGTQNIVISKDAECQAETSASKGPIENNTRFTQTYRNNSDQWAKDPRRSGTRFRKNNSGRFTSASYSQEETGQPASSRLQMFPPLQTPSGWHQHPQQHQQQPPPRPRTSIDLGQEKLPALQVGEGEPMYGDEHWAQRMEQVPHSDRNRRRRYRSKKVQREQN